METRFAYFFAEHNIPFAVSDHLSKLMKGMMAEAVKCPDVATKFSCGRTKTTRIIKSAIAPVLDSNVTALCKERPYSLMIDESNDRGGDKLLVILIRVFDDAVGTAVTRLIDIPICNVSTAAAIYDKMIECLEYVTSHYFNVSSFVFSLSLSEHILVRTSLPRCHCETVSGPLPLCLPLSSYRTYP